MQFQAHEALIGQAREFWIPKRSPSRKIWAHRCALQPEKNNMCVRRLTWKIAKIGQFSNKIMRTLITTSAIKSSHIRCRVRSSAPSKSTSIGCKIRLKFPNSLKMHKICTRISRMSNELKLRSLTDAPKEEKILRKLAEIWKEDRWISQQIGQSQGRNRGKIPKDVVEYISLEVAFRDLCLEMEATMGPHRVLWENWWKTLRSGRSWLTKTRKFWLMALNCYQTRESMGRLIRLASVLELADIPRPAKLTVHTPTSSKCSSRRKISRNRRGFLATRKLYPPKLWN